MKNMLLICLMLTTAVLVTSLSNVAIGSVDNVRYLSEISSELDFNTLSTSGGSFSGAGRNVKFLIDNRKPQHPKISFINSNYSRFGVVPEAAKYHYFFAKYRYNLKDTIERFNASTYDNLKKRFYAGSVQTYRLEGQEELTYAIQFFPSDVISEYSLLEALKIVKSAIQLKNKKIVFVATGNQQTFKTIEKESSALDIALLTIDQILGSTNYIGVNTGEAWGYLRLFPRNPQSLEPTDIPVFDELPLDLAVVAASITKAFQDANSHINLKAKERQTPNVVLRDATENSLLRAYANKPVHLVVTAEGFTLEQSSPEIISEKQREKLNKPWLPLPVVDETRLLSFDELCPVVSHKCFHHSKTMGGKTTGLGFLAGSLGRVSKSNSFSGKIGYNLSPVGFGIPVMYYREFLNEPENKPIKEAINHLVQLERNNLLDPMDRNKLIENIQLKILSAKLSHDLIVRVSNRMKETMPTQKKFKFRSSATSEDIANFNGAGLYDSFSVDVNKTDNINNSCNIVSETDGPVTKLKLKPNSIQCGIKAVYASLWNTRAVVERTFARLDHETAGMGIAVNPSYGEELANAVVVTRVSNTDAVFGYTISSQLGNNLVTNPLPNTLSEIDIVAFTGVKTAPQISTARFSLPRKDSQILTTTLLSKEQLFDMAKIAKKIEIDFCNAKQGYSQGRSCNTIWLDALKPMALDMEVKVLSENRFLFKQVREFHGN